MRFAQSRSPIHSIAKRKNVVTGATKRTALGGSDSFAGSINGPVGTGGTAGGAPPGAAPAGLLIV
ncbi:hypothetical protein PC116_g32650 [Phytophthora cactorum]|nr:hypothetical protein PC116_g32650 [Phytophthora cactorum]